MKKWLFKIKNSLLWWRKDVRCGKMYACSTGKYAGSFLIFIKSKDNEYGFLSIPKMENQWMPKEKFDFAIEYGILEFVKNVPIYVKKVSCAKFRDNEIRL